MFKEIKVLTDIIEGNKEYFTSVSNLSYAKEEDKNEVTFSIHFQTNKEEKEIKELIKEKYFGKLTYLSCTKCYEQDYIETDDFDEMAIDSDRYSHHHLYFSFKV